MIQDAEIDPQRAAALHATLSHDGPPPGEGSPLPDFWHWAFFWVVEPPENLGRDGHPKPGGFVPDTGLPRRMWAGGALEFHQPLTIGQPAKRVSEVLSVTEKTGKSGPLAFVQVRHIISQSDVPCITELQDLVYREDAKPGEPEGAHAAAPTEAELIEAHSVTTTDLFRYSALTFNGHRIHYDLDYCRDVEGYPGLIVHGPLLAQRLIELATQHLGPLKTFTFRARAPVFHQETFSACLMPTQPGADLWITAEDGRLAMTGLAT